MGNVICGSRQVIERAKWYRKIFGEGTRQPGMMAAAALASLNHTLPLLSKVHGLTKATAESIKSMGYKFTLPDRTNMIVLGPRGV